MSRARLITVAALAVLLAAAPFVPRDEEPDASLTPAGEPAPGTLTASLRAEVERVVAEGRTLGDVSARTSPESLVDRLVRCADFEGLRYCLQTGWTSRSEEAVQAELERATQSRVAAGETTGDLDPVTTLRSRARLSATELAEAERLELTDAALSVTKAREVEASTKTGADYPERRWVLKADRVSEQRRSYWCGPAAMQMLAWGWTWDREPQRRWANRLDTTTSGTAITAMVRQVNRRTGWDRESRAGRYITLDIGDYSFGKWSLLIMRHIADYRAPLVLHPVLLKRYFPYLDDDASGHFQVGRGYDKRGDEPTRVGYFEPWNQQRFDPSEPFIDRVQWRNAYRSYRANKAHFQHNIGV